MISCFFFNFLTQNCQFLPFFHLLITKTNKLSNFLSELNLNNNRKIYHDSIKNLILLDYNSIFNHNSNHIIMFESKNSHFSSHF